MLRIIGNDSSCIGVVVGIVVQVLIIVVVVVVCTVTTIRLLFISTVQVVVHPIIISILHFVFYSITTCIISFCSFFGILRTLQFCFINFFFS